MTETSDVPCVYCGRPKDEHFLMVVTDGPELRICPTGVYAEERKFRDIGDGLEADFTPKH